MCLSIFGVFVRFQEILMCNRKEHLRQNLVCCRRGSYLSKAVILKFYSLLLQRLQHLGLVQILSIKISSCPVEINLSALPVKHHLTRYQKTRSLCCLPYAFHHLFLKANSSYLSLRLYFPLKAARAQH